MWFGPTEFQEVVGPVTDSTLCGHPSKMWSSTPAPRGDLLLPYQGSPGTGSRQGRRTLRGSKVDYHPAPPLSDQPEGAPSPSRTRALPRVVHEFPVTTSLGLREAVPSLHRSTRPARFVRALRRVSRVGRVGVRLREGRTQGIDSVLRSSKP